MIYLASPYWHPKPEVRETRFRANAWIAGVLLRKGEAIFCPVTHGHPIHLFSPLNKPSPWPSAEWLKLDFLFLENCVELRVLMLPGWKKSHGITEELRFCRDRGIPVEHLDPTLFLGAKAMQQMEAQLEGD